MRTVGILVGLTGAIVAAACLDAGMSPPTVDRTASAQPAQPAPAAPTRVAPADLTPAAAVRPEPPPAPPPAPSPTPVQAVVEHVSPDGVTETCQLLAAFPFEPPDVAADPGTMRWYRKDDFDDIAELCAMDFYATEATDTTTAVGVCPKVHWSTPALELYDLADTKGKAAFEKGQCPRYRHRRAPKLAKLKAPVYAKEPESALMYFHFSRLLGNAGLVFPATFRTVARTRLIQWSRDAIGYIEHFTTDATPLDGWNVLRSRHLKRKTDAVVGASLAKNPRGEDSHHAFKYYPDQQTRIGTPDQFRKQSYYKLVASRKSIADQLDLDPDKPAEYRKRMQALAYGHDFVNLVVMDHLFNQRDRAGNIHSRVYDHFIDDGGHLRWKKKADDAKVSVPLERLILKDNDDGLLWNYFGRLNSTRLIPDLRHLDSTMYARIQWLAGLMNDPATADKVRAYFLDSVKVQPSTYDDVKKRFVALAARFEHWHEIGRLQLDLDLDAAIAAAPPLPAKPAKAHDDDDHKHRSRRHHK